MRWYLYGTQQPDDEQKTVMRRTATHLLSSPNAAQLEARIIANYGANPRFAFLRGRWARAWATARARAREEKAGKGKEKEKAAGIGGLVGYGDSDEEEEESGDPVGEAAGRAEKVTEEAMDGGGEVGLDRTLMGETVVVRDADEEAAKEARRTRAREWAEKRRAEKMQAVASAPVNLE
jgi:hypothetical protein